MNITELRAYEQLKKMFKRKGYSRGIKHDDMPTYRWDNIQCIPDNVTPGHYLYAYESQKINFRDIPYKYLTKEFCLHALIATHSKELIEYVKVHYARFNKQFYKDLIETDSYVLKREHNVFSYMPLGFIDEEMVSYAMFKSIDTCLNRYDNHYDWFWFNTVYIRKPNVLTQELYILGARCFAKKWYGENSFLDITPKEYRTREFYFALCSQNDTPVMEDIPESILTTDFLVDLLNDGAENIKCFNEAALERKVSIIGKGIVKFWQAFVIKNGYTIEHITLNDERVEFFLSIYDKDFPEYEYGFKDHYRSYLRKRILQLNPEIIK